MGYICIPESFCLFSSVLLWFHSLYGKTGYNFFVMSCLLQCSVHLTNNFRSGISCMLCTQSFNLCVKTPILLAELVLVLYLVACCEGFLPFFVAKANLSDTLAEVWKQMLVFPL